MAMMPRRFLLLIWVITIGDMKNIESKSRLIMASLFRRSHSITKMVNAGEYYFSQKLRISHIREFDYRGMYMDQKTATAVIVSLLFATSAFLFLAASAPMPKVKITETQAYAILEESTKVNKSIIGLNSIKSIELRYTPLDWGKIIESRHLKLYVTRTPVEDIETYYYIESRNTWANGWQSGEGTYIVDAQKGELLLVMENVAGGISIVGTDYFQRIEPGGWSSIEDPTIITSNAETVFTIRLIAGADYDASLPIAVKVTDVPQLVDVSVSPSSDVLNTGSEFVFKLCVFPRSGAPSRFEVSYDVLLIGNVESHNNLYFGLKP
jgi:hypothetical protein